MNLSRHSPAPTRYAGIGLVIALHLAGIYALSVGLIKPPAKEREITTVKPLPPDILPTPQPPEPVRAAQPKLNPVDPIRVPDPIENFVVPRDPVVSAVPLRGDPAVTSGGPTTSGPVSVTPTTTKIDSIVSTPGAVCAVMPRPEVPVVSWSGEAVLQVIATVRGGRVVGTDVRVAQGALDAKTRRSLQRSVESALAGYQCQGDAMFQQDFAFRLD